MITHFDCYRPRRVLPFAAVYALVFINGATLAPFVAPAPLPAHPAADAAAADGTARSSLADDAWRWLQYERGTGETPRQPVMAAGPPPIVKNLRRSSLSVHSGCSPHRPTGRLDDAPRPGHEFVQRALAANAADLRRLCRLLL